MGLPEINDIIKIRNKLGLTLKQMASRTGLTVSWINQFETKGIKDPSYLKIKKIFDYYEFEMYGAQRTAGEICIKNMIKYQLGTQIEKVNKKMIEKSISQIPIFDKDECVGMITSKNIIRLGGTDVTNVKITKEMIESPPPKVNEKTPIRTLRRIFELFEYVLVEKNNKILGILVREDVNQLLGEIDLK